jgi:hypothetical protein
MLSAILVWWGYVRTLCLSNTLLCYKLQLLIYSASNAIADDFFLLALVSLYKSLLPPTDREETLPFPVTCVTTTVPLPLSLLELQL